MQKPLTNREIEAAMHLRATGLTWDQIGQWLAIPRGRKTPYRGFTIQRLVLATEKVQLAQA